MTARVLSGKEIASRILEGVTTRSTRLHEDGVVPHMVFVTLGVSPEAQLYAHRLEALAQRTGIDVSRRVLPTDISLAELDDAVSMLNEECEVDGIIVQMPLPRHLTSEDLSTIIEPRKDVDGITIHNTGALYLGIPAPAASTGVAMMEILAYAGIEPSGLHAVVIGRSHVVGHPVAELLLHADATVTVTHRQTRDLRKLTQLADLLLVGAGDPHLVTADMVREGVVIIDAGINMTPSGIVGDVDFEGCLQIAGAITPVPGGVGPVTNAVLLRNVVDSAERRPC